MTIIEEWRKRVDVVRFNPSAIQRVALSMMEEVSNGAYDIVDPNNPFVFLLEASAVNASAGIVENAANSRKLYPSLALTQEELYLHMSDADYAGRFGSPARTQISFLFEKNELMNRVVETGVGDIKKLTIPRHTEIVVSGVPFTMQYPIDIRLMAHGGLQVVYDVEKPSPLETLTTNIVNWRVMNINGYEFIRIDVPISQFKITSNTTSISLASGLNTSFNYEDQFYYARVFYSLPNGSWKEMRTTHTEQVFDPLKPTALLRVTAGRLNVALPQVYLTTGQVTTEIRVDIYTTRGPLEMMLDSYQANAFKATWIDLEKDDNGKFVAPLSVFSSMAVFSDQAVTGGSNELSFKELRERVMTNALGVPDLPITNVQLTARLQNLGYDMVKDVDNVTNRQFMATRALPRPADNSVVSGAGCTVQTLTASMTELSAQATVSNNGNRLTLLPSTLYQSLNGLLSIVPDSSVQTLMALPMDIRARRVNEDNFLYTPFHYVLDMNNDQFDLRAYYLDRPTIEAKSFVQENDTTGVAVATSEYSIERVTEGYKITVITKSSDAWKALTDVQTFCQLSFRPTGERDRAFLTGTLEGTIENERVYTFILGTDFDVDANNDLLLTTFSMYDNEERSHAAPLLSDFDIIYAASDLNIEGLKNSSIDLDLGLADLPEGTIGIARERLSVRLGDELTNLWRSSRSVVSSQDYERYIADVPALYETTVYERDPETGAIIITSDGTNVSYVVLHAQGDPVLDELGNPVYKHVIGDPKIDPDGNPIIKSSRTMQRQLDLFLIDGVYWFATENRAVDYKASLPDTVVSWVNGDITQVSQYLLEQTNLYFYPKSTLGQIPVVILEDQRTTLSAPQSFSVTYYLRGVAYRDAALRQALSKMAVETINEALQNHTVTMSDITSRLSARAGGDAIGVQITGLGGALQLATVSLEDDSARLSIKKIATALPDGTIGVEDDVSVAFIQHTQN